MVAPSASLSFRRTVDRAFAGLTRRGLCLVVLIGVINGVRRASHNLFGDDPLPHALMLMLQLTGWSLVIAIPCALAAVAAYNLAPSRPRLRYAIVGLAVAAICLMGVVLLVLAEFAAECPGTSEVCNFVATRVFQNYVRYGALCALFTVVFVHVREAEDSALRAAQAERDRARFLQRMEEARLRVLQAQIEPHFLFNTLANVRRLYQTSISDGESMLEHIMRYLAVALPQMREAESTLGREATLAASYLEIQRIRMGARLTFDVEVGAPLESARLPPMMILTLVENAVQHGLAPLPEGGMVRITAHTDGRELQVRVVDTGRGFVQSSGGGTGLANLRARLATMYGTAARFDLAVNAPRGVIATLVVPWSRDQQDAAS